MSSSYYYPVLRKITEIMPIPRLIAGISIQDLHPINELIGLSLGFSESRNKTPNEEVYRHVLDYIEGRSPVSYYHFNKGPLTEIANNAVWAVVLAAQTIFGMEEEEILFDVESKRIKEGVIPRKNNRRLVIRRRLSGIENLLDTMSLRGSWMIYSGKTSNP